MRRPSTVSLAFPAQSWESMEHQHHSSSTVDHPSSSKHRPYSHSIRRYFIVQLSPGSRRHLSTYPRPIFDVATSFSVAVVADDADIPHTAMVDFVGPACAGFQFCEGQPKFVGGWVLLCKTARGATPYRNDHTRSSIVDRAGWCFTIRVHHPSERLH
jgi:hypothetical protein